MNKRVDRIVTILDKHKAEHIEVFDLLEKDYFTDYVIVASSLGERHNEALLDHLKKELKGYEEFLHVESSGEWIVADLGDIIVHIMVPSQREKYSIDKFLEDIKNKKES